MIVEAPYVILLNQQSWQQRVWQTEDPMKVAWRGTIPADPTDTGPTAEVLFEIFNIRHPEGYHDRSLSVGDIVIIGEVAWACESLGWRQVKGHINITT